MIDRVNDSLDSLLDRAKQLEPRSRYIGIYVFRKCDEVTRSIKVTMMRDELAKNASDCAVRDNVDQEDDTLNARCVYRECDQESGAEEEEYESDIETTDRTTKWINNVVRTIRSDATSTVPFGSRYKGR